MTKTLNRWGVPHRLMENSSVPLTWQLIWYVLAFGIAALAVFFVGGNLIAAGG